MPLTTTKPADYYARRQIRRGHPAFEIGDGNTHELLDAYFELQQGRGRRGRSGAGDLRGDLHVNAFGMPPAPHARRFNLKGEFV